MHFEKDTTMQAESRGGGGLDGMERVAETPKKFTPLENMERIILSFTYHISWKISHLLPTKACPVIGLPKIDNIFVEVARTFWYLHILG